MEGFMTGFKVFFLVLFMASTTFAESFCRYDSKDYDSPGFGIPYRQGYNIKGRFGCVYKCECGNGSRWKVTHVLEESHFDLKIFSKNTGGPHAAKWFICPFSVDPKTWTPNRDELGRVIYYSVQPSYDKFPASRMMSSPEFKTWKKDSCRE
jgi:hypothetical protein